MHRGGGRGWSSGRRGVRLASTSAALSFAALALLVLPSGMSVTPRSTIYTWSAPFTGGHPFVHLLTSSTKGCGATVSVASPGHFWLRNGSTTLVANASSTGCRLPLSIAEYRAQVGIVFSNLSVPSSGFYNLTITWLDGARGELVAGTSNLTYPAIPPSGAVAILSLNARLSDSSGTVWHKTDDINPRGTHWDHRANSSIVGGHLNRTTTLENPLLWLAQGTSYTLRLYVGVFLMDTINLNALPSPGMLAYSSIHVGGGLIPIRLASVALTT